MDPTLASTWQIWFTCLVKMISLAGCYQMYLPSWQAIFPLH